MQCGSIIRYKVITLINGQNGRRKSQSFVTSFYPSKKEEQDSQAYKTFKKNPNKPNKTKQKEQTLWLSGIHGWENLIDRKMSCQDTAGVERKQHWKKKWQAGLQGNVHRELYATWSYSLLDELSLISQGTKTAVIKYSSTLLMNLLLCHFLFVDFTSLFNTSFRQTQTLCFSSAISAKG